MSEEVKFIDLTMVAKFSMPLDPNALVYRNTNCQNDYDYIKLMTEWAKKHPEEFIQQCPEIDVVGVIRTAKFEILGGIDV